MELASVKIIEKEALRSQDTSRLISKVNVIPTYLPSSETRHKQTHVGPSRSLFAIWNTASTNVSSKEFAGRFPDYCVNFSEDSNLSS
jgi:hypothetical protein